MAVTLADVRQRADRLVAKSRPLIERIMRGLTAEGPYVGALFDETDADAVRIYRELGFTNPMPRNGGAVLDLLERPLKEVLARHRYALVDERLEYHPGTVVLVVFTMSVAVGRRFEVGDGHAERLCEVQHAIDIEIRNRERLRYLEGETAVVALIQRCAEALRVLCNRGDDRVGLIAQVSHGAKVTYLERSVAADQLRELAKTSPRFEQGYLAYAAQLAAGPKPGILSCIVDGWGATQIVDIAISSFEGRTSLTIDEREELLNEYTVACRKRERALAVLEGRLKHLGQPAVVAAFEELRLLVRDEWEDHDALVAKIVIANDTLVSIEDADCRARAQLVLAALRQSTQERKRGGAVNARGGSG